MKDNWQSERNLEHVKVNVELTLVLALDLVVDKLGGHG